MAPSAILARAAQNQFRALQKDNGPESLGAVAENQPRLLAQLEVQLEAELQGARIARAGDRAVGSGAQGSSDTEEVRVIEDVESFGSELEIGSLFHLDVLLQCHVPFLVAGAAHDAAALVSGPGQGSGHVDEGGSVEPPDNSMRCTRIWIGDLIRADAHGTRSKLYTLTGRVEGVEGEDGEWQPRINRDDAGDLPAPQQVAYGSFLRLKPRQCVYGVSREDVCAILLQRAVIGMDVIDVLWRGAAISLVVSERFGISVVDIYQRMPLEAFLNRDLKRVVVGVVSRLDGINGPIAFVGPNLVEQILVLDPARADRDVDRPAAM